MYKFFEKGIVFKMNVFSLILQYKQKLYVYVNFI